MPLLYSLEESLESAAVTVLSAAAGLSAVRVVPYDQSDESTLPQLCLRCEKLDELALGVGTWNARLVATLTAVADETPDDEINARRVPDPDDDDGGVTTYQDLWKAVMDAVADSTFRAALNATQIIYVWGIEFEPVRYSNGERTFSRSIAMRVWLNESYA
jgi:hypothetical protein